MTRILGFDPGDKHTGWALLIDGKPFKAGVLNNWRYLPKLIKRAAPHHVVAEAFMLYQRKAKAQSGSTMQTSQVIGIIRFICAEQKIPFVTQPAVRIRYDPLVKDIRFHKSKHANDALKHAMAFYLRNFTDAYTAPKER